MCHRGGRLSIERKNEISAGCDLAFVKMMIIFFFMVMIWDQESSQNEERGV